MPQATTPLVDADTADTSATDAQFSVPLIIRGRVIEAAEVEFGGRRGGIRFSAPDVRNHVRDLPLSTPSALAELYELSFDDILQFFDALRDRLRFDDNAHLQESYHMAIRVSGLGPRIMQRQYETFRELCAPERIREMVEHAIGISYLEDWVPRSMASGCTAHVRAFGARAVHIMAGNVPAVSLLTIIRNAVTRSDAILKTPSNDPLTASAIARTMIDMAPEHPLVRHLTVAYWKGGDAEVESAIYLPSNIEKIVAWGGFAAINHIQRYIQPGIDLITLDPKLSSSIIGCEAFVDAASMRDVAQRLAEDIAYYNQEACVNARVSYIQTGTDQAGLVTARAFAGMVYDAIQALPAHISSPAEAVSPDLAEEVSALRLFGDHEIIGGGREGGIIVSNDGEPVEFAAKLAFRIANLVPFDEIEVPILSINAYTQTIGIYPEALKAEIRDRCVFHGAQRLVTLGQACGIAQAGPHDGIEPLRRMCKWIVDEEYAPTAVRPAAR